MTSAELLRVAEILERETRRTMNACVGSGEWPSYFMDSKQEYDEMLTLAAKLREEAKQQTAEDKA